MSASPRPAADADLPVVLLPAAVTHADFITDAQRAACAERAAFARLARRAAPGRQWWSDLGTAPELGHEHWLRGHASLGEDEAAAACSALPDGVGADWRIDPVHLHVGMDHLVLTDPATLATTRDEAMALAVAVAPLFDAEGLALVAQRPDRWYLVEKDPRSRLRIRTGSLLAATGRSVDAYLPRGDDARRCKRLLNEVQMTWFDHPVNDARTERGLLAINSLWIEGRCPVRSPRAERVGALATLRGEALRDGAVCDDPLDAPVVFAASLLAAQIDGDRRAWIEAWNELERTLFADIAAASGRYCDGVCLVLCSDDGWRELLVRPADRWRVWRRCNPHALLSVPTARAAPRHTTAVS